MDERREDEKSAAIAEILQGYFGGGQQGQQAPQFGSAPGMMQAQAGQMGMQAQPAPQEPQSAMDVYRSIMSQPGAGKYISDLLPLIANMASAYGNDRGFGLDQQRFSHEVQSGDRDFGLKREQFEHNKDIDLQKLKIDMINAGMNERQANAMIGYYGQLIAASKAGIEFRDKEYDDKLPGGPMHVPPGATGSGSTNAALLKYGDDKSIEDAINSGEGLPEGTAAKYIDDNLSSLQHDPRFQTNGVFDRQKAIDFFVAGDPAAKWIDLKAKQFGWK
jgi:hypothetical protein